MSETDHWARPFLLRSANRRRSMSRDNAQFAGLPFVLPRTLTRLLPRKAWFSSSGRDSRSRMGALWFRGFFLGSSGFLGSST